MFKLLAIWESLRSSLWFVPAIMVAASVGLAASLIEIDVRFPSTRLEQSWPHIFGAGADGARGMLEAIAGSMITVAGVAFSITIVALALASSQYSPRVMRNFMRDRANQMVLGAFVSIFVYCLVVLRTIRSGDEPFVPSLATLFAVVFAFVGIGCLIFFIHHIAASIQATSIVQAVTQETLGAIDRLFPSELGSAADDAEEMQDVFDHAEQAWISIPALRTGYLQGLDGGNLLRFAKENKCVIRMERGIGEFIVEGDAIVSIARDRVSEPHANGALRDAADDASDELVDGLNAIYTIGSQRTIVQDASFGLSQIVDVALKALSPGINDTHTAVICIDHLMALLTRLATRQMEPKYRTDDGALRVIAHGPTFSALLGQAFDQIRRNAEGNVTVQLALVNALQVIAAQTRHAGRLQALRRQASYIDEIATRTIPADHDVAQVEAAIKRLLAILDRQHRSDRSAEARSRGEVKECAT